MATALFIKRQDLVKNTALSGSVDTDKFIQFIKLAQEMHVRNYSVSYTHLTLPTKRIV